MTRLKSYFLKKMVLERDCKEFDFNGQRISLCRYCNGRFPYKKLTIDHIFPRSKGGTWNLENLALACRSCNNKKSDKVTQTTEGAGE